MNAPPLARPTDISSALTRVRMSLDALLVNGIPYGVVHKLGDGFFRKTADALRGDLAGLGELTTDSADLRGRCEALIAEAERLADFRALPLEEVLAGVARLPGLRDECIGAIRRLDPSAKTATPAHDFLANLDPLFRSAWHESQTS